MKKRQRTRIRLLTVLIMTLMLTQVGSSQNTSSSRSISLAAGSVVSNDISSLDCNPAALGLLRRWDVSFTADYSFIGNAGEAVLRTLAVGRQLDNVHAAALKVSPGWTLDFVVPSTFTLEDSSQSLLFDKKISYREPIAIGYALQASENLSLGMSIHVFSESVTDTKYSVDSNFAIRTSTVNYDGNKSVIDLGAIWSVNPFLKFAAVSKNLADIVEKKLDESVQQYELAPPRLLRLGASYNGFTNLLLAADVDTKGRFSAGAEWTVRPVIQVRGGTYFGGDVATDAIAFGLGTNIFPLQLDVSYLAFLSQDNREGHAQVDAFLESGVADIDFNQFTSNRLSVTARLNFGGARENIAEVEYVTITKELYPAARLQYALQPIGTARVRNLDTKPIEAKVSFFVRDLMDMPSETPSRTILAGETAEIPLYAVFNEELRSVSTLSVREAQIRAITSPGTDDDDRYQARILVHGKNDWNGDVNMLKYFVTPEDEKVLRFTRETLSRKKASMDTIPGMLQNMNRARIVFDEFAHRLVYVNDPKKSEDFVQYPSETLALNGGDCDDMSVCYSALLASMGISTAFIDVVPPQHPERSHIYLMFDTGIDAQNAAMVSENPKRYVVRKNKSGTETVWIPIESTAITQGFEEAWNIGAKEYFDDVELNLGIARGWVKLVDYDAIN